MTDKEKTANILAAVVLVFVVFVFFFGVWGWKHKPVEAMIHGKKIYYLCAASIVYMMSFVAFLLSRVWWLKAISSSIATLFAVNMYQEIMFGNMAWERWSYWFIAIMALNYFILYVVIDKFKLKIKK